VSDDKEEEFSQTEKDTLSIMIEKFPRVALWIKEQRKIDVWLKFFRLIEDGIFPDKNISYQLWLDVVNYMGNDDVHSMRYNEDVRSFWALGYKMFRGKFIRFMSGPKCQSQMKMNQAKSAAHLQGRDSQLNVAVPAISVLRNEVKTHTLDCSKPGIMDKNIDLLTCDKDVKCFKINIDGKKIATGFGKTLGDVDLFGHEQSPTLEERKMCLASEEQCLDDIDDFLKEIELYKENIDQLNTDQKCKLHPKLVDSISSLSLAFLFSAEPS